jgi:hypothetical protein
VIVTLRLILIFVAALFVQTLAYSGMTQEAKTNDVQNWRQHMTALSQTLTDAFPFFYSKREFASRKKNGKIILRDLNTLATTTHLLPIEAGAHMIGAEPLIDSAQLDMKDYFTEAIDLYKKGKIEAAQKQIHRSIQRCFACHTAYQIGPSFPTTNQEVMGMPTPFHLGKAVVFGALRQFDGAQQLAENAATAEGGRKHPTINDMSKLYLVISLRVKQDFPGSINFIDKLMRKDPKQSALATWKSDIQTWRRLASETDEGKKLDAYVSDRLKTGEAGNKESLFVVYLMDSMIQHRKLSGATIQPAEKAAIYWRLAQDYEGLHFTPLEDLPTIYRKACITADPHGPTAHACSAKTGNPKPMENLLVRRND